MWTAAANDYAADLPKTLLGAPSSSSIARIGRSGGSFPSTCRSERDEVRRQCPTCGKIVKLHDAMCMRCGTDLEFPAVAIEPESAALGRR